MYTIILKVSSSIFFPWVYGILQCSLWHKIRVGVTFLTISHFLLEKNTEEVILHTLPISCFVLWNWKKSSVYPFRRLLWFPHVPNQSMFNKCLVRMKGTWGQVLFIKVFEIFLYPLVIFHWTHPSAKFCSRFILSLSPSSAFSNITL